MKSTQTYAESFFQLSSFSLILPIMIFFIRDAWPLSVAFFIFLVLYKTRHAFIRELSVNGGLLEVKYTKYFMNKTASFRIADTVLKLHEYQDDTRRPSYNMLDIVVQNKVKYKLDSREGFSKEMIMEFLREFSHAV